MCTAVTYQTDHSYFGRTLDYEHSFGEEIVFSPRNFSLPMRNGAPLSTHHAILGIARAEEGYPLYFDAVNEHGIAMAGLNFVGFARYGKPAAGRDNVAHFELIPWVLGQCSSMGEVRALLARLHITDEAFRAALPPAQLHWIVAGHGEAVVVESTAEGLQIRDDPAGVLTNNPPFDRQMLRLNDFMHLSPGAGHNGFSEKLSLSPYSRGMGAMGLPGDLSSTSRFVRAAFPALNAVSSGNDAVGQVFHILDTVSQVRGCCRTEDGQYEITRYAVCCDADRGIYHYTTYGCRAITAVDMRRENPDGTALVRYPMRTGERIEFQN